MFKVIPKYFRDRKKARALKRILNSLSIKHGPEIDRITQIMVRDMVIFGKVNKDTTQEFNKLLKLLAAGLENVE